MITETHHTAPNGLWRTYKYDLDRSADVARYVARERFAWPGSYELFALTDDGDILCNDCCKAEYSIIARSYPHDGWHVVGVDGTHNCDTDQIMCDHCYHVIFEGEETA